MKSVFHKGKRPLHTCRRLTYKSRSFRSQREQRRPGAAEEFVYFLLEHLKSIKGVNLHIFLPKTPSRPNAGKCKHERNFDVAQLYSPNLQLSRCVLE